MHLCTISIDRYLSLRYPMRFGRNKTRRRVVLKIILVWLLSIAMSLPLSLMYSKVSLVLFVFGVSFNIHLLLCIVQDHASVLVDGTCQIPDPVYKFVGSIVCFYIPLGVMLITYTLTVQLLARQQQNLGGSKESGGGWSSGWLGIAPPLGKLALLAVSESSLISINRIIAAERKNTWKRLLKTSLPSTPNHAHSAGSTDTELSTLDINTHELWLPESR